MPGLVIHGLVDHKFVIFEFVKCGLINLGINCVLVTVYFSKYSNQVLHKTTLV